MEFVFDSRESQEAAALDNFKYLQQHKLIICKEHGYAVALKRHLSEYHTYPRSVQQAVLRRFHGLPLTAPKDAVLPTAYELPIEGLAPPRKGFECDEADCGWISTRRDNIMKHCRTHGWTSTPGDREHWTELWVQSFSLTPGKQRWFIVSVEEAQTTATAEPTSTDVLAVMDEISREYDVFCAKEKEKMAVLVAELDPTDNTGWWNRTAWVTHLGKRHLPHLAHAARLPGTDEPELKVVADAVGELIEDCVGGLASAKLEVLRVLRSVGDVPDQRPIMRLQNRSSQHRYINYWKRLICYSIRVAQSVQLREAENEERGDEHDEDEEAVSVPEEDDDDVAGPIVQGDRMRDARRLFPWTDETRDQVRRILHSVTCRTGLKRSILDFSRSLIMQKIYGSEFDQPMIHLSVSLPVDSMTTPAACPSSPQRKSSMSASATENPRQPSASHESTPAQSKEHETKIEDKENRDQFEYEIGIFVEETRRSISLYPEVEGQSFHLYKLARAVVTQKVANEQVDWRRVTEDLGYDLKQNQ
ncbi:hypothetical protein E4U47_006900, partial [Claviceps purpurea]